MFPYYLFNLVKKCLYSFLEFNCFAFCEFLICFSANILNYFNALCRATNLLFHLAGSSYFEGSPSCPVLVYLLLL